MFTDSVFNIKSVPQKFLTNPSKRIEFNPYVKFPTVITETLIV
jgi:hypothetical protein